MMSTEEPNAAPGRSPTGNEDESVSSTNSMGESHDSSEEEVDAADASEEEIDANVARLLAEQVSGLTSTLVRLYLRPCPPML